MKRINVSRLVNITEEVAAYKGEFTEHMTEQVAKLAGLKEKVIAAIESDVNQPRRAERKATVSAVVDAVTRANKALSLPVKDRAGIRVTYRVGGGAYPACYRYQAMGDVLYFEHDGKAWYLVEACRAAVKDKHVCDVWMSDMQKAKDFDARVKHGV